MAVLFLMKHVRRVWWFTGLMLSVLVVAQAVNAQAVDTFVLGALYNLSGGMSTIDGPAFNGSKLALKAINEKGGVLGGRTVELVHIDTRTDRKVVASAAKELLSKGVAVGLGYCDTSFVLPAGRAFQDKGVAFVTPGATDPDLPMRVGDRLFMAAFGDDDQAQAAAEFALKRLNLKRLSLWTNESTDFTRLLAVFFRRSFEAAGGTVTSTDFFKLGQKDLSLLTKNLKDFAPDAQAVFVSGNPLDAPPTVDQLRKSGFRGPILSGDGFDTDLITAVSKPEFADHVYFATHAYRGDTRPEVLAFIDAYKKEYGKEPENAFAALGFDAVNLIADAISRAGAADPKKIADALLATRDFKGVTGTISYSRLSRVPVKPVSIVGIRNGAYAVVWTWNEGK